MNLSKARHIIYFDDHSFLAEMLNGDIYRFSNSHEDHQVLWEICGAWHVESCRMGSLIFRLLNPAYDKMIMRIRYFFDEIGVQFVHGQEIFHPNRAPYTAAADRISDTWNCHIIPENGEIQFTNPAIYQG